MSYQGRRRAPRQPLRDRIRDRLDRWVAWWHGWEEDEPLTDDHGNDIGGDLPPVCVCGEINSRHCQAHNDRPVIRTAEVGGVYLPLSGDPNPWAPCAFRQDMPRPGRVATASGRTDGRLTGPGQLTMWDIITCRDPWPPRPEPVTWAGARVPRYVLAGV